MTAPWRPSSAKQARRPLRSALKTGYRGLRHDLAAGPAGARRLSRWFERVDLYAVDHGFLRAVYLNRHAVDAQLTRSAQPSPRHLAAAAQSGVRTIINLRGVRDCGSYRLERRACERLGLALVDFPLGSRGAPRPETFAHAKAIFASIEYPVLIHCKSGADRAGLMAALYLIWRGRPVADAARQLSWRFGHVRGAATGILDEIFVAYDREGAAAGLSFDAWIETAYDPRRITAQFRSSRLTDFVLTRLLRRE